MDADLQKVYEELEKLSAIRCIEVKVLIMLLRTYITRSSAEIPFAPPELPKVATKIEKLEEVLDKLCGHITS